MLQAEIVAAWIAENANCIYSYISAFIFYISAFIVNGINAVFPPCPPAPAPLGTPLSIDRAWAYVHNLDLFFCQPVNSVLARYTLTGLPRNNNGGH